MTIRTGALLFFLPFLALAQADLGVDSTRPKLVPCRQQSYRGGDQDAIDHVSQIFQQIYRSNIEDFKTAGIEANQICINISNRLERKPTAHAIAETGEIMFSRSMLQSKPDTETLAGVLSHEAAHILLFHPHKSNLPFAQRRLLSKDRQESAMAFFKLRDQVMNWRFARASFFNLLPFSKLAALDSTAPELKPILATLRAGAGDVDTRNAFTNPNLSADDFYSQLIEALKKQNHFLDEKIRNLTKGMSDYHQMTIEMIAQMKSLDPDRDPRINPDSLLEAEADKKGYQLFTNSGFTDYEAMLLYLMKHHIEDSNSFADGVEYCQWYEAQFGLNLDNGKHPPICWRLAQIQTFKNKEIERSGGKFKNLQFAAAKTSQSTCNGTPFIMPGARLSDSALILTSGRCVRNERPSGKFPAKNEFLINATSTGTVQIQKSFADPGLGIGYDKILFASVTNIDAAILETNWSYQDLADRGYPIAHLAQHAPSLGQQLRFISLVQSIEKLCEVEAEVSGLKVGPHNRREVYRMSKSARCRARAGDVGAAGADVATGEISVIVQTNNLDGEITNGVPQVNEEQLYAAPVHVLYGCYEEQERRFNFSKETCEISKIIY